MSRHRFKPKKHAKGKQLNWPAILMEGVKRDRPRRQPVSHHVEDRHGHYCGRCGHSWEWHDRVVISEDEPVEIRCIGEYFVGGRTVGCPCREEYDIIRSWALR